LLQSKGERIGVNERAARCTTGFAVRLRGNPADQRKLERCQRRASGNGKYRYGRRLAVTAS